MYKVVILVLLLMLAGCGDKQEEPVKTPSPIPTPTIATPDEVILELNIDNPIVYYDWAGSMACFPYLVEDNNAFFCSIDNTIYYGNALTTNNPIVVKYFALAHEDGHSEDENIWWETVFQQEQFADCYGGMKIAELYDKNLIDTAQLQQLSNFIHNFADGDHGTPIERYHAFSQGYLYGDCTFGIL